jgi:hypothetical protein
MGTPGGGDERSARPSSGLLRVPFVRRCTLEFEDGRTLGGFVVNINVLGAYITQDGAGTRPDGAPRAALPRMGEGVSCRFLVPGREQQVRARGAVSWVNLHQQHPVHSLPPGFGIRFEALSDEDRGRIEDVVAEYVARQAGR